MSNEKLIRMARDWQAIATREAAEFLGTPEGAARLVEAKRYGLLADALAQQPQGSGEPVALTPATMRIGGRYNWKQQPERLVYLGQKWPWHRFALVESPDMCWCECLDEDLSSFEEPAPPSAQQATGSGQVLTETGPRECLTAAHIALSTCDGEGRVNAANVSAAHAQIEHAIGLLAAATQAQPEADREALADVTRQTLAELCEAREWHPKYRAKYLAVLAGIDTLAAPTTGKREPLTDPEIDEAWGVLIVSPRRAPMSLFKHGVRFAEKHHGITGEQR